MLNTSLINTLTQSFQHTQSTSTTPTPGYQFPFADRTMELRRLSLLIALLLVSDLVIVCGQSDPNYHNVLIALGKHVFKVSREREYEVLSPMLFNRGVAAFMYGYVFTVWGNTIYRMETETGMFEEVSWETWDTATGIAARPNYPGGGDYLFVFHPLGLFKMSPENGLRTVLNYDNYGNLKHLCTDGGKLAIRISLNNTAGMAYYIDGTNGIKAYNMDTDTFTTITSTDYSSFSSLVYNPDDGKGPDFKSTHFL